MALFTTHFKQYEQMESPSQACSIHQCQSLPYRVCIQCDHHFCHDHSNEHENRCSQTLPYLTDTIEKLIARTSSVQTYGLSQVERWREEAYRSIDRYCDKKRHDLIEKKQENLKKELDHLQNRLNEKQDVVYHQFNHDIQLIEVKLIELEHLRLTLHPLIIGENLVNLQNLLPLSHAYHTLHLKSGNESSIGSNQRHLLVEREGRYLCLINQDLSIINEILFNHEGVHSICWSSTINRFIIITFKKVFMLDEETMTLEECFLSSNIDWWRGTTSTTTLFLSSADWGSSIHKFDLQSDFQLIKTWHTPVTCGRDEIIGDLKYNNGFLAMPIFNKYKEQSRFDLRDSTTLDCIWSVHIHGRCRCCSINGDQWLVMDHDDRQFFYISADGQLLKTDKYEHHQQLEDVTTWNDNIIVVLTKKTINLHELH